jgi:hypothetical protein
MPLRLLSKLCQKLKTDNIELPPTVEKKLVFGNNTKMKLKNYEIDWFNPEVITFKSIKYLKKNKCPPSTHESQLLFLMNKFEPGKIKLSFSNVIGKVGKAAHKLFYPLPGRKEKNVLRFIQLILSIMIYSPRKLSCKF